MHRIGFVKYLYLMYIDIHVPIKKTESLMVVFSVVGLCVFIVFIFKHFLSIHVIEGKPSKGSQMVAQGSLRIVPFDLP